MRVHCGIWLLVALALACTGWAQGGPGAYDDLVALSNTGAITAFRGRLVSLIGVQDPLVLAALSRCSKAAIEGQVAPEVRAIVASIHSADAADPLAEFRKAHPVFYREATFSLGCIGSPTAIGHLIDGLARWGTEVKDPMDIPDARALAMVGEGAVGPLNTAVQGTRLDGQWSSEVFVHIGTPSVGALCDGLTAWKSNRRPFFLKALRRIGDPQALPGLLASMLYDEVPVSAATALKHGSPDAAMFEALVALGWQDRSSLLEQLKSDKLFRTVSMLTVLAEIGVGGIDDHLAPLREGTRDAVILAAARTGSAKTARWLAEARAKGMDDYRAVGCYACLTGPDADAALRTMCLSADYRVRPAAVKAFETRRDPKVVPILLKIIRSGADDDIRLSAVSALGNQGDSSVCPSLVWLANNYEDPAVRIAACTALMRIGSDAAVTQLVGLCTNAKDPGLRAIAALALLQTGSARAVPTVAANFSKCSEQGRPYVASALGQSGDRAAVPALLAELLRTKSLRDADAVLAALTHLGSVAAVVPILSYAKGKGDALIPDEIRNRPARPRVLPALTTAGHASESLLGSRAVRTLAAPGGAAVPALLPFVNHEHPTVRILAARALGEIGGKSVINPLFDLLSDRDARVALAVAMSLCQCAEGMDADGAARLQRAAHDAPIPAVRGALLVAVGQLDRPELADGMAADIAAALDDKDADVRAGAANACRALAVRPTKRLLEMAVHDPDLDVRAAALLELGVMKEAEAVGLLVAGVRDPDVWLRAACVSGLRACGSPRASLALRNALRDIDALPAAMAADALGVMHDRTAITALLDLVDLGAVNDRDKIAARAAMIALEEMGALEACPKLVNMVDEGTPGLHFDAVQALQQITGKQFGGDIVAWRRWWVEEGSKTAVGLNKSSEAIPAGLRSFEPVAERR